MFDEIRKLFKSHHPEVATTDPVDDVKLAAAAVLIAAARSDGMFGVEEQNAMISGIATRLHVDPDKVGGLLDNASDAYQSAPLESFLEVVRTQMTTEQREAVLVVAWAVIASDGIVTDEENKFAVGLRHSLGLSLEQSLRARKMAEEVEQDGFKELLENTAEVIGATRPGGTR